MGITAEQYLSEAITQAQQFEATIGTQEQVPVQLSIKGASRVLDHVASLQQRNTTLGGQLARTTDALARIQALIANMREPDAPALPPHIVADMLTQLITSNPLPRDGA